MLIKDIKNRLTAKAAQYSAACDRVREDREALYAAEDQLATAEEARDVVQAVSQAVQEKVHERVAGLVTYCLRAIFGDRAYEFKLVFEKKRNRTECRPVFLRDGAEVHPLKGAGGGAADVASFALRLVVLKLSRVRQLLVLDEPFKWLSAEYQEKARTLLEELASDMGVQVLVVTHNEELNLGKVVKISSDHYQRLSE